jgi:hypothetical protein
MPIYNFFSKTGANAPRPPSMDSNEDREMDFDDHRDFIDQDISAGQFPTADPGPIHQFLSGIPGWMNFNQEDLDLALDSFGEPSNSSEGTDSTWNVPSRGY